MTITGPKVAHANAAYAGMPAPVKFDPPVWLGADVRMPECPGCHEGTVFLKVCGRCGSAEDAPACCGEQMLIRGAFVSVLAGHHSWLGCPLITS